MGPDATVHNGSEDHGSCLCWFCPRVFVTQAARTHHMSIRHRRQNRLVPPPAFVELYARGDVTARRQAAAALVLAELTSSGRTFSGDRSTPPPPAAPAASPAAATASGDDADAEHPLLGGLGVIHLPSDAYMRGSLATPRPRNVFQTSTASRIWAYDLAKPEAGKTRRLVPPAIGQQPLVFNTPLLRAALKFALSAGGRGLAEADQMAYISVLQMTEKGGGPERRRIGGRGAPRLRRDRVLAAAADRDRLPHAEENVDVDSDSPDIGELARVFPTHHSFVAAVRGEQRRVLSKLFWEETPLEVEGAVYTFYSRDLLLAVMDLLKKASHVQL